RGDVERARDEWAMALSLDAAHVPTLLGLAWLSLHGGDVRKSRGYLREAHARAPDDARVVAAMARLATTTDEPREVRRVSSAVSRDGGGSSAHALFHDIERAGAQWVVLADDAGLVTGGRVPGDDRVADAMAAELGVVASEATRTIRQLQLGEWQRVVMECDEAGLALAPAGEGAVVLMATPAEMPAGLARLLLDRAGRRAAGWLAAL
ncbi:MAG: roadblock/LC7 domain-containing protein, partial [Gemmatimonadaceae bacterium]